MIDDFEKILLSKVRDIRGLDDVSMFPLATGWWIVFAIICFFVILYFIKLFQQYRYKKTWRYEVIKRLDLISMHLNETNYKDSISEINEIIKRIAIHLYGRKEVAALHGKNWLDWLNYRNPKNVNWKKFENLLINYPYMQDYNLSLKKKEILDLIKAVKNWI